jgi:hypothetical protein
MYDGEFETKLQTVLYGVEALAYLALALWCLGRSRQGQWALLGALGAGLVGIALTVGAVAAFQLTFFEASSIYEKVFFHAHVQTAFTIGRVAGVLILVAAFVGSRRTPSTPGSSLYGQP